MPNSTKNKKQFSAFLMETRETFQRRFDATQMPSVLIAQTILEGYVDQGKLEINDALAIIRDSNTFAEFLLTAENLYQASENQKLHGRMSALEQNTDWKLSTCGKEVQIIGNQSPRS